jgi:aspartyl-tRNA synthetase
MHHEEWKTFNIDLISLCIMYRTHTCGELNKSHADKEVTLAGWVDSLRIQGKIGFLLLRDRYGVTQFFLNPKLAKEFGHLRKESVVQVKGKVQVRPENQVKKDMVTGEVEVSAEEIKVLSEATELPLDLNIESGEDTRLKYRYLDLRTSKMQKNIMLRHKIIDFMRTYLDKQGFVEITTPILTKSTPEGARDYLVPSRVHPGKFYALPQSPQQYKQMLMVAGFDRYFQIAPCFRDEAARAHRCPGEFYQLDLEMSFVNQEDILNLIEDLLLKLVKAILPDKKLTFSKFPRISYDEAMKKYKSDCPDLRKNKDDPNELAFCWVIDFPLFTKQTAEDFFHGAGKNWAPSHHMFTAPKEDDLKYLNEKDAGKAKSYQHDLVLNG